jgi:hypothetical protein
MKQLLGLSSMLAVAACTAAAQPQAQAQGGAAGRDCFNVSFVQGFSSVGRSTVRLDLGPGQKYDVDIEGAQCDQVDWTQRLALESSVSSWICVGDQIGQGNVYFRDPATRRRLSCYIQNVRRVSEPPKRG